MTGYRERIAQLAETVKQKAPAPRWKNQTAPTVEGEIIATLREHGLASNEIAVKGLAEIFKQVHKAPELFYLNTEHANPSANLGKALANRVNGLSKPDTEADRILKSWLKSDTETVVTKHIPRLINYNLQSNRPTRIPLNDLLTLIFNWDKQSANAVINISTNYYMKEDKTK